MTEREKGMRLRPWSALWAGVAVLAACTPSDGPLERDTGDLDARIERTTEVAAELEAEADAPLASVD